MSIDTSAADAESTEAASLAADLGEAVADLPEYRRFAEAKAAVEADEEATERIREFEERREAFVLARQTGEATNEDLRELQAAQEALHDVPVMADFLEAKADLELRLQELNELISEPLAVDFGEKAGGCCQD